MALDKLPLDLIHIIAQDLSKQSDRHALILSCRRFYELLLPTLYSKVTLFEPIDDTKWFNFMHTIVQRPKLAEAVRDLYVYSWDVSAATDNFHCDPNLISQLLDEINQPDDERDEWEEDAQDGVCDAWLGLILPRLTNLRSIVVVLPYGSAYFHQILRKAALGDVRAFSKLEAAYITWYGERGAVASPYLMSFLHFPSMRRLGGSRIAEYDPTSTELFTGEMDELPLIESSGITHIEFQRSNNTEDGMLHLIGSCKALRSFRLGYGGVMTSDDDFHPRALVESLKRHKTSLERLWVEIDCEDPIDGEDMLIGSLVEFTALKHLHVRLPDLLNFGHFGEGPPRNALKDVLPPSLDTLYLSWCNPVHLQYLPQQLDELIQSRRESQLMKFDIQDEGEVELTDPLIEQLRDICSAAGIVFKFVSVQDMDWEAREQYRQSTWPLARNFAESISFVADSQPED
ncbi:hypothetical protein UA08_08624 [Talaromyces atroroseus]|uniref:Leucine-rich repeat domain-containing protein n=1 Tax=Talaromyces atroroseus TaxID=1441469 RepID=A0A225A6D7_TALAT|nr:hypothetical protein UA08_08624 [Talaromyces atroroseus]OKL55942.1 hypothetical protein UA08_08624 [Talaromyces atroroseus]